MSEALELHIERLAYRGAGVARRDGFVYFVPGTLPGETVVAEITVRHKNYAEARLLDIRSPSPDRIDPCCLLASGETMPGAVYDHMRYPAEVAAKQAQLAEVLNRKPFDGEPVDVAATASPRDLNYRNKTVLHAHYDEPGAGVKLGYWREDRKHLADVTACPLSRCEINEALGIFRNRSAFQKLRGQDTVTLRWTEQDGVLCWINEGRRMTRTRNGETAGDPGAATVVEAGEWLVPRNGFFQVNPEVSQLLVDQVAQWFVQGRDAAPRVFDCYCGVGVFGIACGRHGAEFVQGVETSGDAITCARENAVRHGVRARFASADLERTAKELVGNGHGRGMTLIVDPPRRGLAPQVAEALATSEAPRIIYISCDPATLKRDLARLCGAGYRIRSAAMFDMFPRTMHFESAVLLEK